MKAFISSLCTTAIIGVGAWYVLTTQVDFSSQAVNTTTNESAVRLD